MRRGRQAKDIIDGLGSIPALQGCTRADLEAVERYTTAVSIPAGSVLCREGAVGMEAFLILDGTAEVSVDGHVVATLGAGTFCGEMALVDRGVRSATVTALTPIEALAMSIPEFDGLVRSAPNITRRMLRELTDRLREADRSHDAGRRVDAE